MFQRYLEPLTVKTISQKWRDLIYAFFTYYGIAIICSIIILLMDLFVVKILHYPSISESHFRTEDYLSAMGLYKGVALISLKSPIIEELAFRLSLKPNRYKLSVSISALIYLLIDIVWYNSSFFHLVVVLFLCTLVFLFINFFFDFNKLHIIYISQDKLLFVSSLSFGFIHLVNFTPFHKNLFFLYPVYILPQIFLGFILGVIRIRNGFIWAVLLHIMVNGAVTWYRLF